MPTYVILSLENACSSIWMNCNKANLLKIFLTVSWVLHYFFLNLQSDIILYHEKCYPRKRNVIAATIVERARLKLASKPFQQRSMCGALKRLKVE